MGVAGGLHAGTVAASFLIPGVGPVLAFGLLGALIFGAGGAATGALAGGALETAMADGLPRDELYVYEEALRRGRSVVIAFTDEEQIAASARVAFERAGAETVDAARESWWIGLRDVEAEHYSAGGGDFNMDEAKYRLGFESALHPDCRGRECEDMMSRLNQKYGADSATPAFREGYNRGQHYLQVVGEKQKSGEQQNKAKQAA
jgi:hypothetical protein